MEQRNYVKGLILGASAFIIWGLLPLYWKLLKDVSPYLLFSHRVVWSFAFIIILLKFQGKTNEFINIVKNPESLKKLTAPAFFISINWILFIWAINNDYVIESSLGYFINPLVLTIFGTIFYREKLSMYQMIGITLAGIGVLVKTINYGRMPVIALVLAISFAFYGLLKKKSFVDSLNGLAYETLIVGMPALLYIVYTEIMGIGIMGNYPLYYWPLIMSSGVATAVPLLLYGASTKMLPLNVVGFLQYIAPSIMLSLGVFVFKEPFNNSELMPFMLIWAGLVFFSYSQYILIRKKQKKYNIAN